jgi:membrane-bound ClpP family serine protease
VKYLLFGLLVLLAIFLLRRQPQQAAVDGSWVGMVGLTGTAERTFTTEGTVVVNGEIWKATSKRGVISQGDQVRVVAMLPGLILEVEAVSARV